ncbi:MAG: PqqD family protein [Lutibacter sp.]|nr:MAG: PqqD family protein [Lutibacter sp.]
MEKYSRNDQVIDGELDDNQVMMHLEKGKYYGLNPIGKSIWALLETPKSFDEITTALLSEFEVSEEQCIEETKTFIEKATELDILKKI